MQTEVSSSSSIARAFLADIWSSLAGNADAVERVTFSGDGALPAAFAVTDFATAAVTAAGLALSELIRARFGAAPGVAVDRRLASLWFGLSIKPEGWSLPPPWDPIAGDYAARDGWIKLHTNAPRHRAAALTVLGVAPDKETIAAAVREWSADALEEAVVGRGGCAAALRDRASWEHHPQGRAVAAEPVVATISGPLTSATDWAALRDRPLAGLRVLDCTRVLAGPVATRFLAGFGAEVLRIDPPDWDEPALAPEVTLGKRCARIDLRTELGRERFAAILAEADFFIHGFRPGALAGLGFDGPARRAIRPSLIDVSLDAYGWSGPWAGRRGFDSLVQMSAGIAAEGMRRFGVDRPKPLPVPALDHAAGYVMAAAALVGLTQRLACGRAFEAMTSLARMAGLLTSLAADDAGASLCPPGASDFARDGEDTAWGPALRLSPPLEVEGMRMAWTLPSSPLGSAAAKWATVGGLERQVD
jgi:CoA-transferase family III